VFLIIHSIYIARPAALCRDAALGEDAYKRVDADETVGLAHVVRTRKLIDILHADINLTIFGKDHSLLKGYFPEAGFFGDQNTCYQNQNFDAVLCHCTTENIE